MTSSDKTALPKGAPGSLDWKVGSNLVADRQGRGLRVGLACALFNGGITWRLLEGALEGFEECGVARNDVTVAWAPGAFELPLVAQRFALAETIDAVVCLGAVIRGDTGHYDFVAGECASGIQRVQLDTGVPVIFGVLTTDTIDQALERSVPGHVNKGREAALTAIDMVRLLKSPALSAHGEAPRRIKR